MPTILKTKVVPDTEQAPWTLDIIECPECNKIQSARIFENRSETIHLHECIRCGFVITKKDWSSVQ